MFREIPNNIKILKLFILLSFIVCWMSVSTSFNDILIFFDSDPLNLNKLINFFRHLSVYICLFLTSFHQYNVTTTWPMHHAHCSARAQTRIKQMHSARPQTTQINSNKTARDPKHAKTVCTCSANRHTKHIKMHDASPLKKQNKWFSKQKGKQQDTW